MAELFRQADAIQEDPTSRFAFPVAARDVAAEAGDLSRAFRAVERISTTYQSDDLEGRVAAIAGAAAVTASVVPKKDLAAAASLAAGE